MVKAIANSPKSSGARSRARTTERTKAINCPISDDDIFQLTAERTLFSSDKFVAAARLVIILADWDFVRRDGVIQQPFKLALTTWQASSR